MKIKTHKYLKELKEAERRGYERGQREAEERMWQSRRIEDRDRDADEFRARILKTLEEHEKKFSVLCGEADAKNPASANECDVKCDCVPVVNCNVVE